VTADSRPGPSGGARGGSGVSGGSGGSGGSGASGASGVTGAGGGVTPGIGTALMRLTLVIVLIYTGLAAGLGWWQVVQAGPLSADPANPLSQAAERSAPRGTIYDSQGVVVAQTVGGAQSRQRRYPHVEMAPIVGYKSLLFGTAGLENAWNSELIGLDQSGAGDALLRKFRSDPYDPSDLHLSVDLRLQQEAVRLLGSDRGAVVAIEPSTGRILAMASTPSFDPNRLVDTTTARAYLDELRADTSSPLLNRATQGRYVPGSVFKMVTATAALDSGSITPDTTYPRQPAQYRTGFKVEGFTIHDAPRTVQLDHPLTFPEATEVSSNIFFAHAALDTGAANLSRWAAALGFGQPIPFELPTATSQVTDGTGPLDGFTDQVELANAAYGQGEVLATPLQMALVACAIANGGSLMKPTLVDRLESDAGRTRAIEPTEIRRAMSGTTAGEITDAMVRAVNGPFAAGYAGGAAVPGVTTAGKSGTAELGTGRNPHSWFIGFAPAQNPQIAVAVIVERAGTGSSRAVPLGGDIMSLYLSLQRGG
jgi:penicillin-binding protein A